MRFHIRSAQRGMTLIELLVTMVLMGFIVSLMSGAFVQIAQMLRISSEHGNGFSGRWTQSRALQDIVANLVPEPDLLKPLEGTTARISLTTMALPPVANGIAQRAKLELVSSEYSPGAPMSTVLQVTAEPPSTDTFARSDAKPFELARFNGRLIFVYVDDKGKESRQWPPFGAEKPGKLPKAIGLRDESKQGNLVQLANYEGPVEGKLNDGIVGMFGATP